jgi:hypothetical protein
MPFYNSLAEGQADTRTGVFLFGSQPLKYLKDAFGKTGPVARHP